LSTITDELFRLLFNPAHIIRWSLFVLVVFLSPLLSYTNLLHNISPATCTTSRPQQWECTSARKWPIAPTIHTSSDKRPLGSKVTVCKAQVSKISEFSSISFQSTCRQAEIQISASRSIRLHMY
jgi:hypothetical protein